MTWPVVHDRRGGPGAKFALRRLAARGRHRSRRAGSLLQVRRAPPRSPGGRRGLPQGPGGPPRRAASRGRRVAPGPMARRQVSIRWSLLRNLLLLVALLSGSILALTFVQARRDRPGSHGGNAGAHDGQHRDGAPPLLRARHRRPPIARDWTKDGMLRCRQPQEVTRLLMPALHEFPQISSVNTGDPGRRGVLLLRETGRLADPGSAPRGVGTARQVDEARPRRAGDPYLVGGRRLRPAHAPLVLGGRGASAGPGEGEQDIQWTDAVHVLHHEGPRASRRPSAPGATTVGPGSSRCDVLLNDISGYTKAMQPTENGAAFVVGVDGRVVGLPRHDRWADEGASRDARSQEAEELGLESLGGDRSPGLRAGGGRDGGVLVRGRTARPGGGPSSRSSWPAGRRSTSGWSYPSAISSATSAGSETPSSS